MRLDARWSYRCIAAPPLRVQVMDGGEGTASVVVLVVIMKVFAYQRACLCVYVLSGEEDCGAAMSEDWDNYREMELGCGVLGSA